MSATSPSEIEAVGRVPSGPAASGKPATIRAVALFAGAAGLSLLAVWARDLHRTPAGFVLQDGHWLLARLPAGAVPLAVLLAALGACGLLTALRKDSRLRSALGWARRWAAAHVGLTTLLAAVALLGTVDVYELVYDHYKTRRVMLRPWMLRDDLRAWLFFGATVCAGLALSALWTARLRGPRSSLAPALLRPRRRWPVLAFLVPFVLAAVLSAIGLEGVPHFSDAATYLFQGRVLMSGRLVLPKPAHPELIKGALFILVSGDHIYGKYPIGWPLILGLFDAAGVGFLANAALCGSAALLTGAVARQFTTRRVAAIAALLFALAPWTWLHGADFTSHPAATCAVLAFLWLFLRALRRGGLASAAGAGLALGAAVLVRPFDAAMFALPAVAVVGWKLLAGPRRGRWWVLGPLLAAGALIGVGVYLWVNRQTTGGALTTSYSQESKWDADWRLNPLSILARIAFQCAELNASFPGWGLGGLTVAVLGGIVAAGRRRGAGLWIVVAGTSLFFVGAAAFGFENVWWGSRWLMPVTPLLAILAAELLDAAISAARPEANRDVPRSPAPQGAATPGTQRVAGLPLQEKTGGSLGPGDRGSASAAQLALCLVIAGIAVGLLAVFPGELYRLRVRPPHNVSSAVHREAQRLGLTGAVVALPPFGEHAPLDARSGVVYMGVPFEANEVIYVRAVEGWPCKASETFPGRRLYEARRDDSAKGFELVEVEQ